MVLDFGVTVRVLGLILVETMEGISAWTMSLVVAAFSHGENTAMKLPLDAALAAASAVQ